MSQRAMSLGSGRQFPRRPVACRIAAAGRVARERAMSSSQPDYGSSRGHDLWIATARDMFERLRSRAAAAPTIASHGLALGDPLETLRHALPGYELVEEI